MALRPHTPADLMLAPVAAAIDANLAPLRALPPAAIEDDVALTFNVEPQTGTREDRARWIGELALRFVDLHGWRGRVTPDATRLHLEGGSVTLDIGLSASLQAYIEHGAS